MQFFLFIYLFIYFIFSSGPGTSLIQTGQKENINILIGFAL